MFFLFRLDVQRTHDRIQLAVDLLELIVQTARVSGRAIAARPVETLGRGISIFRETVAAKHGFAAVWAKRNFAVRATARAGRVVHRLPVAAAAKALAASLIAERRPASRTVAAGLLLISSKGFVEHMGESGEAYTKSKYITRGWPANRNPRRSGGGVGWLGDQGSNLDSRLQRPLSYH